MSLQPINKDHVVQIAQVLLTYLDSSENSTPNDMLEGIVSGKSLMRSLIAGNLVICQQQQPQQEMPAELKEAIAKKEAEDEAAKADSVDNEPEPENLGEMLDEDDAKALAAVREEEAA